MTDRLTESDVTEHPLTQPLLRAHGRVAGCYALRCDIPPTVDAIQERWDGAELIRPGDAESLRDDLFEHLASADTVVYVGASERLYGRLCEHATKERRGATFLDPFPPTDIFDICYTCDPKKERSYAENLSRALDITVWVNGEVVG